MPDKMLTPKFLTPEIAQQSVESVLGVMKLSTVGELFKRQAFHIVILVPSMKDDRAENYPDWPHYQLVPKAIYEHSVVGEEWSDTFKEVARCKALQLWQGRNDSGTDIISHLLFPSDTRYYGGVSRQGIVVACSGVQPWFDRMISGMIADMLIGLAYNKWMMSTDRSGNFPFLT